MSIILWIDPGSTTVWYALIEKKGHTFTLLDYGVISTTPKIPVAEKLFEIGTDIKHLIEKYSPNLVAIEKIFFTNNLKTGIDVAQCRGVVLYETIKASIALIEYTPLQVKKAITGNGAANKKQLQNAIKMILRLKEVPKPDDAADAIGIAYMGAMSIKNTK
jgi:crossover junction endodeoxyribonuclease RuvC